MRRAAGAARSAIALVVAATLALLFGGGHAQEQVDEAEEEPEVCEHGPYCALDPRTQTCTVSRSFVSFAVERFMEGGVWHNISMEIMACEEAGKKTWQNCTLQPRCEIDHTGRCVPSRLWAMQKLSSRRADGGAGLGVASRCGLLGRLLGGGAICRKRTKAECSGIPVETTDPGPNTSAELTTTLSPSFSAIVDEAPSSHRLACAWDSWRHICDVSQTSVVAALHRDYRPQLALLAVRRQTCAARSGDRVACQASGDSCHWVEETSQCTLPALKAVVDVIGEHCPMSVLFRQRAACSESVDRMSCANFGAEEKIPDLPHCFWNEFSQHCEAHPMHVEFKLLSLIGIENWKVVDTIRYAETRCRLEEAPDCGSKCVPAVPVGKAVRRLHDSVAARFALLVSFAFALFFVT